VWLYTGYRAWLIKTGFLILCSRMLCYLDCCKHLLGLIKLTFASV
jgi:hypothetical protein